MNYLLASKTGLKYALSKSGVPNLSCTFSKLFHSSRLVYNESKLNSISPAKTRNIGIIAHIDAGKTTTTERMLYYSGKTNRIGNVDEGDTVTDYLPSERQRGITIQSAAITIPWNNNKINIIDTPGHADFTFEVIRSLRVLDGVVTILDGVAGVEAQTEKVWKQADTLGIPKIAYINKMDRDGAGFSRTVKEIIQKLQTRVILCNIPHFENGKDGLPVFTGVLDILHKKVLKWDSNTNANGKDIIVIDVDSEKDKYPEQYDMIHKSRESMVETLGDFDDSIIESFFENDEDYMKVPSYVLDTAIRKATIGNFAIPIFCGSSFKNIGVQPLMDGVLKYLPSPLEINMPEISSNTSKKLGKAKKNKTVNYALDVKASMDPNRGLMISKDPNLTVALAFKVMTHATRGVMTFFRVYSGKLTSNTTAINTRTGKKLNLRKLLIINGDEPEYVSHVGSGNIGVISGLEDEIMTGDTIVSHGPVPSKLFNDLESNLTMLPIEIPPPLFNSSLEPLTAGDSRHMNDCIRILEREDPSMSVSIDDDLGQTIISGMGELHLEIIKDRLVNDMKAKVRLRDVAVSYKETITDNLNEISLAVNDDQKVSVQITMDSFEEFAENTSFAEEDGAVIFKQENCIIILEPSATPAEMHQAISERRWKSEHSLEDLQDILIQSCFTGLQIGGPILGLPLHSMVIRIKSWSFPFEDKNYQSSILLDLTRRLVRQHIDKLYEKNNNSFTILEPIMTTKLYVNSDVLGEVIHDLNQKCQAVILSTDDESGENLDALTWANEEAEKIHLPPDYTMSPKSSIKIGGLSSKKVIVAETPLREMIGYLSRLRSITQGRGVFDMNYLGMRRANKSRLTTISNEFKFNF